MEDVNYSLLVKFNRFVLLMADIFMCHGTLYFKSNNLEDELLRALFSYYSELSMYNDFYFTVNVDIDCIVVKVMDSVTDLTLSQIMLLFPK